MIDDLRTDVFNKKYSNNIHINLSQYSEKVLKKCEKYGCYLFLKDFTIDL